MTLALRADDPLPGELTAEGAMQARVSERAPGARGYEGEAGGGDGVGPAAGGRPSSRGLVTHSRPAPLVTRHGDCSRRGRGGAPR